MSTIMNTPSTPTDNSLAALLLGFLFTGVVIALFIIYGLPAIRSMTNTSTPTPTTIEVQMPTPTEPVTTNTL